jgi:hypothetical protein
MEGSSGQEGLQDIDKEDMRSLQPCSPQLRNFSPSQPPEQQEEMYEDIVANTDPIVRFLESTAQQMLRENGSITPSNAFFSAKRNLISYRQIAQLHPLSRNPSEADFESDHSDELNFEEDPLENLSDSNYDEDFDDLFDLQHCLSGVRKPPRSEVDEHDLLGLRLTQAPVIVCESDQEQEG